MKVLNQLTLLSLYFCTFTTIAFFNDVSQATTYTYTEDDYRQVFERRYLFHERYRHQYLALTDINYVEALQGWFQHFLSQNSENFVNYSQSMEFVSRFVLGRDYRRLIYYYVATSQYENASRAYALYLLSGNTVVDNFVKDPLSKKWDSLGFKELTKGSGNIPLGGLFTKAHSPINTRQLVNLENCIFLTLSPERKNESRFKKPNPNLFKKINTQCLDNSNYGSHGSQVANSLKILFLKYQYHGAPFPISFTGYVPGNKVKISQGIPMEPNDILNLGEQLNLMVTGIHPGLSKPYHDLTIEDFQSQMNVPQDAIDNFFTSEEGFQNTLDAKDLKDSPHNTFGVLKNQNTLGMYGQMIHGVRQTTQSVFIDIFWMGGTIGMNLAKEVIQKAIDAKKNGKEYFVYIITDMENKFQYENELVPIYNYMRAFSENFPDHNFYITEANVDLKKTALPEFFDLLITNGLINNARSNTRLQDHLKGDGFHLLGKSDHSKVIIGDGMDSKNGIAYIGSKNWTDSSGGANFDEIATIQGPAVPVILDSLYYEAFEAFKKDFNNPNGSSMTHIHLSSPYMAQFQSQINKQSKEKEQPDLTIYNIDEQNRDLTKRIFSRNDEGGLRTLLRGMDVIQRYAMFTDISNEPKYQWVKFEPLINLETASSEEVANSTIAPSQNNVYGSEASPQEQNVHTILSANHQIIIDDQFLYDGTIVDALRKAREKGVKIYVVLESLLPYDMDYDGTNATRTGNILNNLFLPELVSFGAQVRWQITPPQTKGAVLTDKNSHSTDLAEQLISATFHLKTISIDGVSEENSKACGQREENSSIGKYFDDAITMNTTDPYSHPVLITGSANKDVMTMSGGFGEYQVAIYDPKAVAAHDCFFWQRWNTAGATMKTNGLDFVLPDDIKDTVDPEYMLDLIRGVGYGLYYFSKDWCGINGLNCI